jgi:hypothetical protein
MAEPARKYDPDPPRAQDPFNPAPPLSDPARPEPLTTDTTDPRTDMKDKYAEPRRSGNGVLIAVVVLVLAAIAFYVFAPGANETTVPTAEPQSTAPAEPAPAPSGTQPAQPAPAAPAQ